MAARADRPLCLPARALCLCRVQGGGMALVAFRHALWQRASGIEFAARCLDRPLPEGHRLDCPAGTGVCRLRCNKRRSGREHERSAAQSVLRAAGILEKYSAAGARRYRLSGVCAGDQRRDQGLSVARSVGEGACLDRRARYRSRGLTARRLARLEIRDAAVAAELGSRCTRLDEDMPGPHGTAKIVGWSLAAMVSIVAVVLFGVPLAADRLTPLVPQALEQRLGE